MRRVLIAIDEHRFCGNGMQHVLIVQSSELQRLRLTTILREICARFTISEADSLEPAVHILRQHPQIDAVMLDFSIVDKDGASAFFGLRLAFPRPAYILMSGEDDGLDAGIAEAIGAKAHFHHAHSVKEITKAIGFIKSPVVPTVSEAKRILASLSSSQVKVLKGIQQGLKDWQIAHEMGLTENAVRGCLSDIYRKLGINSRTQVLILLHGALTVA